MPEPDEFDLVLRSALSTYADPGPESGIEARILARVSAEAGAAPRHRWLPWAIALPIAAGLLLLFLLSGAKPNRPTLNAVSPISPARQPQAPNTWIQRAAAPQPQPRARTETVAAEAAPLPKLDVFPTPQPLTPEEQALTVFAARAPQTERQALLEAQKQSDAPLIIAAIQIQPLDPPDQGGN